MHALVVLNAGVQQTRKSQNLEGGVIPVVVVKASSTLQVSSAHPYVRKKNSGVSPWTERALPTCF